MSEAECLEVLVVVELTEILVNDPLPIERAGGEGSWVYGVTLDYVHSI